MRTSYTFLVEQRIAQGDQHGSSKRLTLIVVRLLQVPLAHERRRNCHVVEDAILVRVRLDKQISLSLRPAAGGYHKVGFAIMSQ